MLTVKASPNEDPISLKYVLRLSVPGRQILIRITEGRCGHQYQAVWQGEHARARLKCDAEPEGAGGTDEAIADALDISPAA